MTEPTPHDLAVKVAALEERMKTQQAEYKTDLATIAGRLEAEIARRDARLLLGIAVMLGLAVAILGVLIRLPMPG